MADKKYFWLKLHKDFFKRHDIRIVEGMPNGKDYILFYLKLLVESVSHDGNLRFSDTIPYSDEMLSTITGTNVDIVRTAMKIFTELEMIEVLDDATIFMNDVENMIGSASDDYTREQNRIRQQRHRDKQKALRNVTVTLNRNVEIRDKSIDINNNIYSREEPTIPYSEIVDYLNKVSGSNYKASTDKTKKCIKARINEGFTVDDFKTVIDKKCAEWKGTEWEKFLRPETLFGTKFESYLQQKNNPKKEKPKFNNLEGRTYDFSELEKIAKGNNS